MIDVVDVTKRYGSVVAVEGVSFHVNAGDIVGFLGPNGAGKSTLLKMMCTWLPLTSGRITVAGHDVSSHPLEARRVLGYLTEHNAMYETMRVDQYLRFVGRLRGVSGPWLEERMAWVGEKCSIKDVFKKRVNQCSKGYRQRVGVAAALIHDPQVILLDEPTHGLDPLQVVAFREFIRELAEGRAILFSSHNLSEVASISDRLLVISHGRLLVDTSLQEMQDRAASHGHDLESEVLGLVRSSSPSAGEGSEPGS
ncbi:MAG: ATP-binding cassette domain-containing protein [Planctomycetota bacterium]|nr:ATP-binding cassette domain-containing protein [Planctomycetota bacterium]